MKKLNSIFILFIVVIFAGCSSDTTTGTTSTNTAPVITSSDSVSVSENQTSALTITATDAESDALTFSLSGADAGSFTIDSSSGVVTFTTAPDYEVKNQYLITVNVSDGTDTTTQAITVNVFNVGDVAPILVASTASIAEDALTGASVGSVIISSSGDTAITAITLSGTDSTDFVVATDGTITVAASLDYETKPSYSLSAVATNSAGDSTSVSLTITITDVLDVVPTLDNSTGLVAENATAGTYVGDVNISSNGGSAISAITLSGTNSTDFVVGIDGTITVAASLDFETKPSYSLTAIATNITGDSIGVSLTITVSNIAETKPTLTNSTGSVAENSVAGTSVGNVTISIIGDTDITAITLSGTGSANFTVDTSGAITVNTGALLDFETTPSYSLNAIATNGAGDSASVTLDITITDVVETTSINIPTVVVIMNWSDVAAENDPAIWKDKIFNSATNSVNQWYDETTAGELQLVPITESSLTANDGVITVNMGVPHPGFANPTAFITGSLADAITDAANYTDFAILDVDNNGNLDREELLIIYIVAGGEMSYGDTGAAIWAHAGSYSGGATVDGKTVMNMSVEPQGWYGSFGSNHFDHKATIGVIVHEVGHALMALNDYYDEDGGSGLGWFDVMSGGSWAQQVSDTYPGDTPMQFSAFNRTDSFLDVNVTSVSASADITIKCSSKEVIKLVTTKANEYFLVECRDTTKANSDISFNWQDFNFTEDRLFMMAYHIEDSVTTNPANSATADHYKVALIPKDDALYTTTPGLAANFSNVYYDGDATTIPKTKTILYDTADTNYTIQVTAEDTVNRTMTISITK